MALKFTSASKQPASRAVSASAKPVQADDPKFDRKAYQRELMRQRRAKEREAGLVTVKLPADVVSAWKATGEGWKERMVEALRSVS